MEDPDVTPLLLTLTFLTAPAQPASGPREELLWPKGAPGALGTTDRDKPSLTIYLPPKEKRTGTAVVVLPGGGYGGLALGHEGREIADWLNQRGIAAFVVKYRLGPRYRFPAPLQDAQRALQIVRSRVREFGINPARIGIWGFSAGGHLASTVSTRFNAGKPDADDPIERVSNRPDFAILCYPVIRLDAPYGHAGSRRNLLGDKPDEKLLASLCNDTQVTKDTPPTFLFHTRADKGVPIENSELYLKALKKAGVPAKLVAYDNGPHGVGLAQKYPDLKEWPSKLQEWLVERRLLPAEGRKP